MPKLAPKHECTGCMACIDSCAHHALSFEYDDAGFISIITDEDRCVGCGVCTKKCPILNPLPVKRQTPVCFSGWADDDALRAKSASGGFFAAVAEYFLRSGGVVYGASISGFMVSHQRIDSTEDLYKLQGSKYQPSDLTGVYIKVRKDLLSGRKVLFSGLGCQIGGLITFLGSTNNKDNLFTIDTICGGVGSVLPIMHLQESGIYRSITSFRNKNNGWKTHGFKYNLTLVSKNGDSISLGEDNLVLKSFSSPICKRSSCLDCRFTGISRNSDCTIGDFWGIEGCKKSEESKGISAILVHSNRFLEILSKVKATMSEVSWIDIAKGNPKLWFGKTPAIRHFVVRKRLMNTLKCNDYGRFQHIVSSPLQNLETILYNKFLAYKKKQLFKTLKQNYK